MSYAIIRNAKYTINNLNGIYRHNERKNTNYSNKDITKEKAIKNYSLKSCNMPYSKAFRKIKEENNLQGWIKKNSNVACEYIITSDKEFFENIGEEETKRYFKTAFEFVKNYKDLGEKYILSAKIHNDESTPHLHLVFIPVVHKKDSKSGKVIDKISCSEFWKGKNSYKILQDNFYSYMIRSGFDLERGNKEENEHIPIEKLKKVTNYEVQEMFKETNNLEREIITDNVEVLKDNYKRVIRKFNTVAKRYTKIKNIVDETMFKAERLQRENQELKRENVKLKSEVETLKNFINKTFECVHILFDFPIERLKSIVQNFWENVRK